MPGKRLSAALLLATLAASSPFAADPLPETIRAFERAQMRRLGQQQLRPEARIAPFRSDGCSGGLSATWQGLAAALPGFAELLGDLPPWENCCIEHDRAYWRGESVYGYEQRLAADERLRACVIETGARDRERLAAKLGVSTAEIDETFRVIAEAMYQAVRLGGAPCTGLPWRWGHGWPECGDEAGSAPLTDAARALDPVPAGVDQHRPLRYPLARITGSDTPR